MSYDTFWFFIIDHGMAPLEIVVGVVPRYWSLVEAHYDGGSMLYAFVFVSDQHNLQPMNYENVVFAFEMFCFALYLRSHGFSGCTYACPRR